MAEEQKYYACYCRLDSTSADSLITVDGNAMVIGVELSLTQEVHVNQRGKEVPRIVLANGDYPMGFLPVKEYKKVTDLQEKGWVCRAFLSLAVYNRLENSYWAEVALVCYSKEYEKAFAGFCDGVIRRICKGGRPDIDLSDAEVERVIETNGQWAETNEKKRPKLEVGSAYFKTRRSFAENMAYAAAEGNKGCYVSLFIAVFIIIFTIIWFVFFR